MRQLRLFQTASLVVGLVASSCAAYDENSDEPVRVASDSMGIDWDTFRQSATTAPNGSLVVEGDMTFSSEQDLYAYWAEELAPGRGHRLTVDQHIVGGATVDDLWTFPSHLALTYCIGSGFTAAQTTQLLPALDAAAEAWSRIVGVRHERVTVSGTCDWNNTSVVFDVQRRTGSRYNALAFFPREPRSARTLFVYDSAFTATEGGRTLTGILTHELGHTLGFRHEHIWLMDENCSTEPATEARLVTEYDQLSVMHYPHCRTPTGGGYSISALDYAGAVQLYGLAPALTTIVASTFLN